MAPSLASLKAPRAKVTDSTVGMAIGMPPTTITSKLTSVGQPPAAMWLLIQIVLLSTKDLTSAVKLSLTSKTLALLYERHQAGEQSIQRCFAASES